MGNQAARPDQSPPRRPLPDKIVVLSDGTGNSAARVWRTNVWRTFEFLDLTGPDQVAMYDDGVGTSSFLPLALLGGAFGGLKRDRSTKSSFWDYGTRSRPMACPLMK